MEVIMPDLVTLTCPTCGGKLQIANNIDRFACGYCGNEHIVQRSGGVISLEPVLDGLKVIKTGVDKTVSELAIQRLNAEIANLMTQKASIPTKTSGCIVFLMLFSVLLLIILLVVSSKGVEGSGASIFFGLLIVFFTFGFYFNGRNNIRKKISPIDEQIEEKTEELEYHRNIIKSK